MNEGRIMALGKAIVVRELDYFNVDCGFTLS